MRKLLILSLVLCSIPAFTQQIDLQSISSLGGSNPISNTEWTTGETVIQGNDRLTQGFHQGKIIITAIFETTAFPEILVYPNPAIQRITVEGIPEDSFRITLLNTEGKKILQKENVLLPCNLELGNFPPGSYFLHLATDQNRFKVFKINKIK